MSDQLTKGWAECQMGDVAEVIGGGTPSSKEDDNFAEDTGVPWITPADLSGYREMRIARGRRFLTAKGARSSSAKLMPKGTVLFSSRAPIGYVAIADSEMATNQGFKSFICADGILPEYVYFWLKWAKPLADELASGTTFPEISGTNAAKIPFIVAPTNEQRRIVAKLEEALARIDASKQRLAKIPVLLKRFRQSVLAAACSGRLTADWRDDNATGGTAEDLIAEVSQQRRRRLEKLTASPSRPREVSPSDFDNIEPAVRNDLELPDLPESWSWVDLRFMMSPEEAFCYGVVQPGEDDPKGPRLVRVCDLEKGRVVREGLRGIPPSVHAQYQRSAIRGGEVLVSVVGTIGRPAIADSELVGANIARAVAKIPVREFVAKYVVLWLSTSRAESWMIGDAREVARKTLNLEQLRTLPTPLPPLPEQHEIVRRVDALFKLADQIEARFEKARAQIEKLTPALLAKAFRGELVPQDPADEPASVLLERIRAKRTGGSEKPVRFAHSRRKRQSA